MKTICKKHTNYSIDRMGGGGPMGPLFIFISAYFNIWKYVMIRTSNGKRVKRGDNEERAGKKGKRAYRWL